MDRALVILQDLCRFHVHSENKPSTAVPGIYYCFTLFTCLQIQLYLVCTLFTGLQTQLYLVCTILCLQVYKYSCTWYVLLSYFVYRFTNTAVPSVYYCLTLFTGLQTQLYPMLSYFVYRFTNTAVHGIYYYFTLFTD